MFEPANKQVDERLWRWNRMWLQHKWMYHRIRRGSQMDHSVRIPEIMLAPRAIMFVVHRRRRLIASLCRQESNSVPVYSICLLLRSPKLYGHMLPRASYWMVGSTQTKRPAFSRCGASGLAQHFLTLRRDSTLRRSRYSPGAQL